MTGTRKSGKEGRAKGIGKKTAAATRPVTSAKAGSGKAAAALKESEEKYKLLIEATNTGYVIIDEQGRVLDANEEYVRLAGYGSLEEIIGRAVTEWTAAYDLERNAAEVRKCMKSGAVRSLVLDYVGPQGRITTVEINATVLRRGGAPRIFTVCRDIAERKWAEDALRETEARARCIVESSPVGMHLYRLEPDGRLVFTGANPAADKILGVDNSIFIGKTIEEAFPSLKGTDVPQRYREAAASGKVWQTESIEYQDDAIKGAFEVHAFQTAPNSMVAAFEDITQRKKAEARIEESEKKYRTLFESSNDGIFILDLDGNFIDANPAAYTRLGYTREEMLSLHISKLDTPEFAEKVPERIRQLRERGAVMFEAGHLRKDGSVMPVEVNARRLDFEGRLVLFSVIRDITERKQAEAEIAERGAMLQQILDTSSVAIFLVDKTGRITQANRRMAGMFGCTMEELAGREYVELVHPSEREDGRAKMLALLASKISSVDLERHYWRKDGTEFWGHLAGRRFHDVHGNELGLIGVISDITERKQADEALRKSEKMLQTIFDAEPECVKLLDEDANLIMMNKAGLDMLEVDSLYQVKGQCVCPMITSEYRQEFMDLTKRVFQGESGTLMFEMVGLKGRHLWMETHAVPLRNEKDKIVALLGVTRDVTEHKRAEDALRENQARLDLALQAAHMGVWRLEVVENRRYFDDLTYQLLGIAAATFTGSADEFFRVVHPADRDRVRDALSRTLEHDAPYEPEYRVVWPDGTIRFVTARGRLVRDDRGRPVRINGILWDITEKKLLEEERLKAQKLESVGTLAGGIAHDFNNLLQGIFGYISMAKLTIDQREKSLAMLEQAEKALHQSVNLTSQLLTFSKGGKPVRTVIDLRPVIENAVTFALSGSQVSYDLSFGDDLSAVEADAGQLGQVVQNIVLNAEQAMPLGGRIKIAARNVPPGRAAGLPLTASDGLVEIVVRDQGMGIPPEHLPRIFDPYFTTKEKGSGLGLATSYSIVKNHDGMIAVSSVLGKGSTFTVYLPASGAAQEQAAPSASAGRTVGRKGKILVMDDEPVVRIVAGELLRELGHEVEFAEHGDSAIEKYRRAMAEGRPFDLVILDLTIRGGMGGLATLSRLKEIDPEVKAVVSSGYSDDAEATDYKARGFRSFLKKPYDIQELGRTLDDVMA